MARFSRIQKSVNVKMKTDCIFRSSTSHHAGFGSSNPIELPDDASDATTNAQQLLDDVTTKVTTIQFVTIHPDLFATFSTVINCLYRRSLQFGLEKSFE